MKEIYQVMNAAIGQEMRMDQIANNLANVNTVGFKKDNSVFVDELQSRIASGMAGPNAASWPSMPRSYTDFSSGSLQDTGRSLDLAIESDGFFEIRGADGRTCYTRAGNFSMNPDGELVNGSGRSVLDSMGKTIKLDPAVAGAISVTQDGQVSQGATPAGKLAIVKFEDESQMIKRGEGLFEAPDGIPVKAVDAPRVRQGALEGSNVNAIDEMVRMIQVQRMYDAQQRVVRTFDDLAGKRIEAMQ